MKQARFIGAAALGLTLVAAVLAAPASAKVTPKDGVYYQALGKPNVQVGTYKGKVTGGQALMKFKTGKGKVCLPDDFNHDGDLTLAYWTFEKPLKVDRKSRFQVRRAVIEGTPTARVSISGKFKTPNKASVTVTVTTTSGCDGSISAGGLKYYAGG